MGRHMNAPLRHDTRLALFEAEMLYLCADLGSDVLARAIEAIETLRAESDRAATYGRSADTAVVLLFPAPAVPLDATG